MPTKHRIQTQDRVKVYKPKTKTGCITCRYMTLPGFIGVFLAHHKPRIRRIKCDEARPDCQKCASTGRRCDGYRTSSSSSNKPPLAPKRPHALDLQLMESDLERRSFDFFRKRTVGMLSGIFDPSFWTRLVLQATHHEPAIRHAVVALGALHESFEVRPREEPSILAMQQYGKAIGCLIKPIQGKQTQAADVALMTCVLFFCFDVSSFPRS